MARATALVACVLVLASVACIHAARFPSYGSITVDELPESVVEFQNGDHASKSANAPADNAFLGSTMYNDLEALVANPELSKKEGWPIHIATKFFVKPDKHVNFIHKYWQYSECSRKDKGILHLSLNKVSGDNIVWTGWTVYKDIHALFEHMRSEALRDWASFIMYENIAVEYELLIKIGGCHHKNSNGCLEANTDASQSSADDNKGGKHREWPLKLVTKYIVPPGKGREFVEEWERLEKKMSDAKGNLAFALFKPATDNVVFVGFSAWESHADFWAAAKKKATEEFIKFLGDQGVVVVTHKIWGVPSHHP